MKPISTICKGLLCSAAFVSLCFAQADSPAAKKPAVKTDKATAAPVAKKETTATSKTNDTLVVVARITEIPGKFAPNDLYNYVYVMKYRVLTVVKGTYKEQDILVGQYNPLIPRAQIKDAMKKCVAGNADKFDVGAKHKLTLIKPIDKVWKDAVEDEYTDSNLDKYFAVRTDLAQ